MKRALSAIGKPAGMIAAYAAVSLLVVRPPAGGRADLLPWDALTAYPPWTEQGAEQAARPHNALITDMVFQFIPWQRLNRETLEQGYRARWNPYALCGQPLHSGLLQGYRYPLDFLRRVMEPARAAAWMMVLHLVLGASFCAWLTRRCGAGWPGATAGGLVYAFSAPVFFNMTFHTMQGAIAWMPGCLLAVQGCLDASRHPARLPRLGWAAGVVLTHALSALSGHPELTVFACLLSAALVGWTLCSRYRCNGRTLQAGWTVAALLAAFAATAWMVYPEVDALRNNFRADTQDLGTVRAKGLPAYQLSGFLVPDFSGSPVHHRFFDPIEGRVREPDRYAEQGPVDWGDRNAVEGAVYWRLLPLALLGCAGWARRDTRFFWFGLAAGCLLAFGTPLYALVYYGVPFARQLRTPVRWMIPAALCAAVLAGCGLEQALTNGSSRRRLFRAGLAGLILATGLVAAGLGGRLFPDVAARLATPVFAGAARVQQTFSGPAEFVAFSMGRLWKAAGWIAGAGLVALWIGGPSRRRAWAWLAPVFIAADLGLHQGSFFTRSADDPVRFPPPAIRYLQSRPGLFRIATFGETKILPPNTAMLFGLHDLRGYASVIDRRLVDFLDRLEPQADLPFNQAGLLRRPETLASPWMDFLNVEFLMTDRPVTAEGWTPCFDEGLLIYRNREAYPRYYLARTRTRAFEEGPPPPLESGGVTVVSHAPHRVRLSVDAPEEAWLVSSETDLGFWEALIDGQPAESRPLLGLFRCVRVGPGQQVVEWRLRKP